MVVMARPRETKPRNMTEFGRTLYALMLDRGYEHRRDLADLLTEAGYKVTNEEKEAALRRALRRDFAHLRKMPSMWTTAYFATTAGRVSEATIQEYIEAQSKRA